MAAFPSVVEQVVQDHDILVAAVGSLHCVISKCRGTGSSGSRHSHFVNAMLRNVYKRLRIHHITTTPYHPQTDGMVERFNGTLKSMLKRSLSTFHSQWDQALPFVLGEYRSSPCRATGFTPAELLLGRNLITPMENLKNQWSCEDSDYAKKVKSLGRYFTDLIEGMEKMRDLAKGKEERYKEECKNYYDRNVKERKFDVGDLV